jgi:hypothetical protein
MCDPITGYLNTDGSPTKTFILAQNRQGMNHWMWELNFGRRPAEELYDLSADPDCMINLATERAHAARRAAMQQKLFADLETQKDPRMSGQGAMFDRYPHQMSGFYAKFLKGENPRAGWVEDTDFEKADFDPERPLRAVK